MEKLYSYCEYTENYSPSGTYAPGDAMPPIAPTLRSLRHYALSGLGIVSLLLSAIIAIVSSIFGGGSDPIDPNANVVFTVVDQYGHG